MKTLTRAQRKALHRVWQRNDQGMSYRAFRRTARCSWLGDYLLVRWCGMTLGIEADGFTHS
jgi:hypothetical protein